MDAAGALAGVSFTKFFTSGCTSTTPAWAGVAVASAAAARPAARKRSGAAGAAASAGGAGLQGGAGDGAVHLWGHAHHCRWLSGQTGHLGHPQLAAEAARHCCHWHAPSGRCTHPAAARPPARWSAGTCKGPALAEQSSVRAPPPLSRLHDKSRLHGSGGTLRLHGARTWWHHLRLAGWGMRPCRRDSSVNGAASLSVGDADALQAAGMAPRGGSSPQAPHRRPARGPT